MKELSKIIREFEKLSYKSYDRKGTKHEPTDSYFYLSGQLAKCMMRDDALNLDNYPLGTEMLLRNRFRSRTFFLWKRANQYGSFWKKTYRMSVLRTRVNQKALSPIKVLRRRANKNALTKE